MKTKISFVIPCYKSSETINLVVNEIDDLIKKVLSEYDYNIVLVNDGSPDNLDDVLTNIEKNHVKVKYISLSKNFGQHNAIMAGLNNATGDLIVCLDDDGQTPVHEIPKLLDALNSNVDVVYARYNQKKHSIVRNFGSFINDYMLNIMLDKPRELYISSFFVMKKYVKDEIIKYKNPYPYLGGLILRITNKIVNVDTIHNERSVGDSTYTPKKLLKLWSNGLTNFSVKPLRLAILFSGIFISFAAILVIILVLNKINNPSIPIGWTSGIVINLIIGSIITFMLGIIGEYLGRIYISINNIPQYVVKDCDLNEKN